jgi:propionate CoA-transferase
VFAAIEARFLATGHPRNLTIIHALGIGDGVDTGLSRFAYEGMVARVIGGHWSWSPRMQELVATEKIEAYALPTGAISGLLRESGSHRPGFLSRVGLGTFVDPRNDGGRLNERTREEIVSLTSFDGHEYLRYHPLKVDVAIVRGSSIDDAGNLSVAEEAASLDSQAVAASARGNGGVVIAQVKRHVRAADQDPRTVSVPGPLVDYAVVASHQWQTYAQELDPTLSGIRIPAPSRRDLAEELALDARGIVARRAALEVRSGEVVNFGFGMSAQVIDVLAAQDRLSDVHLVIEQGAVGGRPETGRLFGLSRDPGAMLSSTSMFDLFATGMLDLAILGMAEADRHGNVNVSKVGGRIVGPGGFIDIATAARRLVFCGTLTAKGLRAHGQAGRLVIESEGSVRKFVNLVSHVTYGGEFAMSNGQDVLFVTERAVFALRPDGLELIEIAPGIDLESDVLAHLEFNPIVRNVVTMPCEVFDDGLPSSTSGMILEEQR